MLFNWFKRKNAQAAEDKDKGTVKFNAVDVFVDVNGQKVSVADLEKYMIAEEAEKAKMAELDAQENAMEPMSMDDTFLASNGKEYKVGDMVNSYLNAMTKKNAAEEEAKKKAVEEAKAAKEKENAGKTPEEIEAEKKAAEEAKAKENAAAEDAKKNAADAEAKAKAEAEEKEKKENAKKKGEEFFTTLKNAGEGVQMEGREVTPMTRADRAALGAKRYGSKQ
jgi:hypothetical protein